MISFIMSIIYGIGFGCCAFGWYSSHKDNYMLYHKISLLQGAEAQLTNSLDFYIEENKKLKKLLPDKLKKIDKPKKA